MSESAFTDPSSSWYIPKPGEFRGRRDYTLHVPKIVNLDERFRSQIDPEPVVLNSFDFDTPGYAESLATHVFSRAGAVDFIPRCSCKYYTGAYFEGSVCPKCHTVATSDMEAVEGHLAHKTWISCPEGLPGWLHPSIYIILHRWMSYGRRTRQNYTNALGDIANKGKERKGSYLDDILDVTTPIPDELKGVVTGKGFKYLHDNFWFLIEYFATSHRQTAQSKDLKTLLYFLRLYSDRIFCRYIPIQSSSLHSIIVSEGSEDTRKQYVDKSCQYVLSAAAALSYLEHSTNRRRTHEEIEEAAFEAYQNLIAYSFDISIKSLSKKRSLPRAHIFGARMHNTIRGVIVPVTGPHKKDELQLPWKSVVNNLRDPIIGRLMWRDRLTPARAVRKHLRALQVYDPDIHQILLELHRETRDGCDYKLFVRNPSIRPGSLQEMKVPPEGVKTDPDDCTIGFSSLACAAPNADRPLSSTLSVYFKYFG